MGESPFKQKDADERAHEMHRLRINAALQILIGVEYSDATDEVKAAANDVILRFLKAGVER